ncbi:hypothetical protein EON65_13550 [archaeon]|nr:MAG: hypothetical protein EON65_13550 [archaeon]
MDSKDLHALQQMVSSQLERDRNFKQKKARQLESLLQVVGGSSTKRHEHSEVTTVPPVKQQDQLDVGLMFDGDKYSTVGTLKPLVPWKQKNHPISASASTLKHTMKVKQAKPRKLMALSNHPHGRGIIRSIDVVKFSEPTSSTLSSISTDSSVMSDISEQLVHDVTNAFKDMYAHRHLQQKVDEDRYAYVSRIKTPPELANDELTTFRSRELYNEIADDMNSIISNAASSFSQDFSIKSLSSKSATVLSDLHSAYTQETTNYHSAALFVEARYLELKEIEKETGNLPTHKKAVVIAALAMTLTKGMGRFSPVS